MKSTTQTGGEMDFRTLIAQMAEEIRPEIEALNDYALEDENERLNRIPSSQFGEDEAARSEAVSRELAKRDPEFVR